MTHGGGPRWEERLLSVAATWAFAIVLLLAAISPGGRAPAAAWILYLLAGAPAWLLGELLADRLAGSELSAPADADPRALLQAAEDGQRP